MGDDDVADYERLRALIHDALDGAKEVGADALVRELASILASLPATEPPCAGLGHDLKPAGNFHA